MRSALALYALCACDLCALDHTPPGVRQFGSEPPPRADEVIEASGSVCGRDLRGTVTWTPGAACGTAGYGCSRLDVCHLDATVFWSPEYAPWPTALDTALAHEIGHYCWDTTDEARAEEFAAEVRRTLVSADEP